LPEVEERMMPRSVPAITASGLPGRAESERIPSKSLDVRERLQELPPFVDFMMVPDEVP